MRHYRRLNLDERRRLYQLRQSGRSVREAATELGRHVSTVYRELSGTGTWMTRRCSAATFRRLANDKAAARRRRGLKISLPMSAIHPISVVAGRVRARSGRLPGASTEQRLSARSPD
ncbi:helix-turn-helix domain-containing protein [Sphingomonas trueperi]|uniref:helix-turn-helix domain-containing protein n=1 Tax=Sphingomonas trueperi TaxID=53317 RepID=UPI000EACD2E6